MASGNFKRPRGDRVSGFSLPPGQFARTLENVRRGDVLLRVGLCALAAIFLWLVSAGWAPPFSYRTGYLPERPIITRVEFQLEDKAGTAERNQKLRREMLVVYENDPKLIVQLQQALKEKVFRLVRAETFDKVDQATWREFYVPGMMPNGGEQPSEEDIFNRFREALAVDTDLAHFEAAIRSAMQDFERNGLLLELQHKEGDRSAIYVHPLGDATNLRRVEIRDARIDEVAPVLEQRLFTQLRASALTADKVDTVGKLVFAWIKPRLPVTLSLDEAATQKADDAIDALPPVMKTYVANKTPLVAEPGRPLTPEDLKLLREEHDARVKTMTWWEKLNFSLATLGMYAAIFTLCGAYLYHNHR
jgi:membrane-associated HD superfamily phosphohydrolase